MKKLFDCPFCNKEFKNRVLIENSTFCASYDLYPVSPGHILLIPRRHVTSFFDLSKQEVEDFYDLLLLSRNKVMEEHSPEGFNIGINNGFVAGQTISHLHIHLIPRYKGDVQHPEGGVRKIIPNFIQYPAEIPA
jgi:diadenosine tetraphosphate (Ap4A) HIT family hydrolase